ncbi:MAG: SusC/RagA family TonB-linked outer membrane protein [Bacteroidota bacterium]
MKKILGSEGLFIKSFLASKILKVMRITLTLLFLATLQLFAGNSYSQSAKLTLNLQNSSVENILDEIEQQSEFFFVFNYKLVDVDRQVDIQADNKPISEVLASVFSGSDVDYMVLDRQILLSPKTYLTDVKSKLQPITVTGTVTDENGKPLPGVSVIVKGTTRGSISNLDGKYSIEVGSPEDILEFSFMGMQTQEINVSNQTSINVTMEADAIGLEELVVIGYGTARKMDLTGSIAKAVPDETKELSNSNVLQSLQGSVPGLNIGQVDQSGEEPSILIRGYNTLSTSQEANRPLFVVDGVIYRGNTTDLNPLDIESVNVLKGISSSAIYGSQASNGVIIITTKKGTKVNSKPIINFSAKYTHRTPNEHALEPMGADEHREFYDDLYWEEHRIAPDYINSIPDYSLESHLKDPNVAKGWREGTDFDWYDEFTSNGQMNQYDISIRGRSEDIGYFVSAGSVMEEGYRVGDEYEKINVRMNFDFDITDWLSWNVESFVASSDHSGIDVGYPFSMFPYAAPKDDEGNYLLAPEGTFFWLNPFLVQENDDLDKRLNLMFNSHINVKIPFIEGLAYKFNYSNNYQHNQTARFEPYGSDYEGSGSVGSSYRKIWSADNLITYNRVFDAHRFDLTLLYGVEKIEDEINNSTAVDFPDPLLSYYRLEAGDPTRNSINTGASSESSLYQMARINYGYNDKYLLTGTIRRDGFSGFGPNEKIGTFPSAGIGWVVSRESFLNVNAIDFLKIRGSYGSAGRRAVRRYQTLAEVESGVAYTFGDGASPVFGQHVVSLSNYDLAWEKTTGLGLGLDYELFDSRIRGSFDYYNNNTEDILYDIQLPYTTGFGSIPKNISQVHNYGIEAQLSGDIVRSNDLNWEVNISFSRDRNEIVELLGDGEDLVANELFIGEPQNVVYDYEIGGMWQLDDEIPTGFHPGTYKIVDLNGDGEINAADDRRILGYEDPSYRFNITNRINYKGFTFYFNINSIQGGKDYYYGVAAPHAAGGWGGEQLSYTNVNTGAWDYWMPENPNSEYRRLLLASSYRPTPYMQRNFVRLQDVMLSYTFNNIGFFNYIKVFFSGKNLITLTKWQGWDPETGVGMTNTGRPVMRNLTVGLNVEF